MIKRFMLFVATLVVALAILLPCRAYADAGACFSACRDLVARSSLMVMPDAMLNRCVAEVPACRGLSAADMREFMSLCDALHGTPAPAPAPVVSGVRPWHAAAPTPSFCFLPNGASVDDARHRCRCPVGTLPLRVDPRRSADRLRSFGVPPGREVYLCADPLAPRSAPGSYENRSTEIESWVEESHAAIDALCAPNLGEDRVAACQRARQAFLATGSGVGPVDLGPLSDSIANLIGIVETHQQELERLAAENERRAAENRHQETEIARNRAEIGAASSRAEQRARDTARREAERVVHETVSNAFVLIQGYGLVSFNALDVNNGHYGLPWQIGAELTLGVGLGGAWNFHGGIGVARGGPRIPGVTTTAGEARLGLGVWVKRYAEIGFGLTAAHRFMTDARAVHSIYGGYVDVMFRFMPDREWSPVLTIRGLVGATPRFVAQRWQVQPDAGLMLLLGFGHF